MISVAHSVLNSSNALNMVELITFDSYSALHPNIQKRESHRGKEKKGKGRHHRESTVGIKETRKHIDKNKRNRVRRMDLKCFHSEYVHSDS